ncbi:serine protease [Streptomyces sp. NPDC021093]|uniref:serine protease n=1 Tax=Streptomyces sp. NPDC021093 TaxID=3365112 RepID=UPI0037A4FFD5
MKNTKNPPPRTTVTGSPRHTRRWAVITAGAALLAACVLPSPAHAIVGGSEAAPGAFPSTVSIGRTSHSCGGVIISEDAVLTTAMCVAGTSARTLHVRYGSNSHASGGNVVGVSGIISHPSYDSATHANDIALLRTATPMTLGGTAQAASLAPTSPPSLSELTVAGWGETQLDGSISPTLRQVTTRVVGDGVCQLLYGNDQQISASMVCAGLRVAPRGFCFGDLGSPAYNPAKAVTALATWPSPDCNSLLKPDIYTAVAPYKNWILAQGVILPA